MSALWSSIKAQMKLKLRLNHYPSFYSSHSQFGEDMMLRSLIGDKKDGFYIDIGAHHPYYYSNTYHFYLKGWKGLNIDANPGSMKVFKELRPNDINLEACIAPESGKNVTFYAFEKPALNTFDDDYAKLMQKRGEKLVRTHSVVTQTLEDILKEHNLENKEIDFLSIDIEGVDEIVLKSLDYNKVKPKVIAFEDHHFNIEQGSTNSMLDFLKGHGYHLKSWSGPSLIVSL